MHRLTDYSKLAPLLAELPVVTERIRYLLYIAADKDREHFVFVDDLDNPASVLYFQRNRAFYTRRPELFLEMLEFFRSEQYRSIVNERLADDPKLREYILTHVNFGSLLEPHAAILRERFEVKWENPCYACYWDAPPPRAPKVPLAPLKPEHAQMVEAVWEYGDHGEGTIGYFRQRIETAPSMAFYEGDVPVAWCICHDDGSIGHIYTAESHRRRGLAKEMTYGMVRAALAGGWLPFCHIKKVNEPSLALAEKAGFTKGPAVSWIGASLKLDTDSRITV